MYGHNTPLVLQPSTHVEAWPPGFSFYLGGEEGGREAGFPLPRALPEILNFAGSTILNCKLIFFTLKS